MLQHRKWALLPVPEILERMRLLMECENDAQLARALEIPQTTISSWKRKDIVPYEACVKIAEIKGVSTDIMFFGEPIPNTSAFSTVNERLFSICYRMAQAITTRKRIPQDVLPSEIELAVKLYNSRIQLGGRSRSKRNLEEFVEQLAAEDELMIDYYAKPDS